MLYSEIRVLKVTEKANAAWELGIYRWVDGEGSFQGRMKAAEETHWAQLAQEPTEEPLSKVWGWI